VDLPRSFSPLLSSRSIVHRRHWPLRWTRWPADCRSALVESSSPLSSCRFEVLATPSTLLTETPVCYSFNPLPSPGGVLGVWTSPKFQTKVWQASLKVPECPLHPRCTYINHFQPELRQQTSLGGAKSAPQNPIKWWGENSLPSHPKPYPHLDFERRSLHQKNQLPQKGHRPPIVGPCMLWSNGWMDRDATWYGGNLGPGDIVLSRGFMSK